MNKLILGGLILFLVTACAPTPIPVPPIETRTPEPKYWREFPVIPGGVEIDDDMGEYHYTVITEIDDVLKFYRQRMQGTQWELVDTFKMYPPLNDIESAEMLFADTENIVSLQVWSKGILTHVAFMMDARYPTPQP